jgi:hypothetical protein
VEKGLKVLAVSKYFAQAGTQTANGKSDPDKLSDSSRALRNGGVVRASPIDLAWTGGVAWVSGLSGPLFLGPRMSFVASC